MNSQGTGWASLTGSALVVTGPTLLWGIVVFSESQNDHVSVYDGQGSSGSRHVLTVASAQRVGLPILFSKPLHLDEGLYVSLASDVHNVLVSYESL